MKERTTELVHGFRHAVPYINTHRNKIFVIMLNGEAIKHKNFYNIINDIGLLHSLGIRLVIVYGARPQINTSLKKNNIQAEYYQYNRITDIYSLELIKKEAGSLQLEIIARLSMSLNNTPLQGANINVVSGNFVIAQPLGVKDGIDYIYTGCIRRIEKDAIVHQLNNKNIVLIGPIAASVTGENFNLLSEDIATKIAISLQAEKMIGFCNEQGITNSYGEVISEIFPKKLKEFLKNNQEIKKSTVLFLRGAIKACQNGVKRSHFISYQENGALLQELFSREGIGTQIVMESSEKILHAKVNDIGGIIELIRPLEKAGILVYRSRKQLETEIDKFIIIKRENLIIACVALYVFKKEKIGEMACLAVHPDYRKSSRGQLLLRAIENQSLKIGLKKIFVMTTCSIHWFQENGFVPVNIDSLPKIKRKIYNHQRKSKILMLYL
ncbi:amino-acid N-acetyltransferase [Candidatus Tachikawaea gelatinosa]|uniref:Amino-acid acetyltransferase n=1 Tax=Candidatus Tachikawaea gelatinosa TaxID=1410383 RepID=A0A090AJ26_9ENTR|nr:amino-acid N-acetyltransferase [Candidatus Tachikawaea gelatinosa]BAP58438.1 amino-acid acetyltransferase [Candidatus Tachikawaea gelatinosa]